MISDQVVHSLQRSHGWTREFINDLVPYYMATLTHMSKGHATPVFDIVDEIWHAHILCTRDYARELRAATQFRTVTSFITNVSSDDRRIMRDTPRRPTSFGIMDYRCGSSTTFAPSGTRSTAAPAGALRAPASPHAAVPREKRDAARILRSAAAVAEA